MRLIDDEGILSVGTIEPNTGTIQLSGWKKVNMVNPSAVLMEGGEGGATLKGQIFQLEMADNQQTRKKSSLLQKFQSLPADVLMRAGAATLGADSLPKGMQQLQVKNMQIFSKLKHLKQRWIEL